ncbi:MULTISPECIES: HipA domain-containing protein [unclassified Polaribacter]|uniref:HipA domain-containing protein n=1 Tax=unclassified Polaribacter TaxID=196858 RepID=UPI0011BFAAC6|nr:HipA domain-containing protein [Polaribacter sp. IC063]TXD57289.1 HipA domain-containing protein [Polaribacter sp. IC066]
MVDLFRGYILRPQTEFYEQLHEIEHLTIHLAKISNIKTVKHSLKRLKSGHLAYLTKRIDSLKNNKLHLADMCQLSERQTEHKYKGSHEQIAKKKLKHFQRILVLIS